MDNPYEQEQQRVLNRIVTTLEKLNESVLALNHAVAVSFFFFGSRAKPSLARPECSFNVHALRLPLALILGTRLADHHHHHHHHDSCIGNERVQFIRV